MELTHDWRGFQSLFLSNKDHLNSSGSGSAGSSPVYLILNGKVIVCAFSVNDDLSEWLGATEDELRLALPDRELISFEKLKVDEWIHESLSLNHFYDQIQFFKTKAKSSMKLQRKSQLKALTKTQANTSVNTPAKTKSEVSGNRHFLLHGIQTWWARFFPSTYGIYLQVEGSDTPSLLMVVQRGQIHSFHPPDLSSLPPDRRKQSTVIVKYLSERYLMPIQGVFIAADEWIRWSESENPWLQVFTAIRGNRSKLVPCKFSLVSLIALRAYWGV